MAVSRVGSKVLLGLLLCLAALPSRAADKLIPLDVALGDVSLNKVSFLIAADTGIYARNGLDVHQFITPGAAAGRAQFRRRCACRIRQGGHRQRADFDRRRQPDDLSRRQRPARHPPHRPHHDRKHHPRPHHRLAQYQVGAGPEGQAARLFRSGRGHPCRRHRICAKDGLGAGQGHYACGRRERAQSLARGPRRRAARKRDAVRHGIRAEAQRCDRSHPVQDSGRRFLDPGREELAASQPRHGGALRQSRRSKPMR